jgi:PTH1 family peptidyl-tRNA hydrolase
MFLIVGLGNPGAKYEHTRHNVGFDVLTLLAEKLKTPVTRLKCRALVGETFVNGEKVVLCKPQTYMNLSGEAVQALMHWYRVEPDHLLVIYDDIDLAPGVLRLRKEGSAGTHNGMRSIIDQIGTQAFPRIRVGIGPKREGYELADWVLSHYATPQERQVAFDAYLLAADAAIEYIQNGIGSAMGKYNSHKGGTSSPSSSSPSSSSPASPQSTEGADP